MYSLPVFFYFYFFFFNDTATTEIYTLSLHDALPISIGVHRNGACERQLQRPGPSRHHQRVVDVLALRDAPQQRDELRRRARSEEHTSELQSPVHLVCRLLLEKKKKQ